MTQRHVPYVRQRHGLELLPILSTGPHRTPADRSSRVEPVSLQGLDQPQVPFVARREHGAARHPDTLVLSTETGHNRDYSRSPYGGYAESASIFFPVKNKSARYHPKELVIGVNMGDSTKAYPFSELSRFDATVTDDLGGSSLQIEFDAANRTGRVLDETGKEVPSTIAFWFAWYAFFPDTGVFDPD